MTGAPGRAAFAWTGAGKSQSFTVQGDIYKQKDGESVVANSYTQPYSRV